VSQDHSRKQFLGRLLGITAVAAVATRAAAKLARPVPASAAAAIPFQVRAETRAVARRDGAS